MICRNGTNSSEIERENVGAQFRSLRNTFQFAGVRWATLAYVWKFDRGSALSAIRSSSLEYAGLPWPTWRGSVAVSLPPPALSVLRFLHKRDGRKSLNKVGLF